MSFRCPECGGSDERTFTGDGWKLHVCQLVPIRPVPPRVWGWELILWFWFVCIVVGAFLGYAVAG